MTTVLALNLVLAIVVVAALVRVLGWAIISSRGDQLPVRVDVREPARRPYRPRPHAAAPALAQWAAGSAGGRRAGHRLS